MTPMADEWVEKAEGDFATAQRECRARKDPNHDAACFHAQQCAEKYLKAILYEADIEFPRTHDLAELLELVLPGHAELERFRDGLSHLSPFAVMLRYPGWAADKVAARDAVRHCRAFRRAARAVLGLENR